jgi:zinc transport system substrate-binding protein
MKVFKMISAAVCTPLIAFFLTANADAAEKTKLTVAVTIVPQKAFVEAVAGTNADIVVMIPPGFSPGNYEPKPKEMEAFSKAKLFFTIGVPTETKNIIPKANDLGIKIIPLQVEVSKKYPDREFSPGKRDPHMWLSPKRAKLMADIIARELGSLDPKNKAAYLKNAKKFSAEIDAVDANIKKTVKNAKNRKFIVFHPAYGYFADEYGLEMHALEKDGKEATPERLKDMIDFAKKEGIKTVFYQAEISSRQAKAFADEIGGQTIELAPLSGDYINNLKRMAEILGKTLR